MMKTLKTFYVALIFVGLLLSCGEDEPVQEIMVDAGTITGGPFSFMVDGTPDFVTGVSTDGMGVGTGQNWIITDAENTILGLPPTLEALEGVDFDGAGVGVCLIWYLRYEGDLSGLDVGENTDDLMGNFDLSNSITVNRGITAPVLSGGPFNFIVDGTTDNIPEGGITVDSQGTDFGMEGATGWIVTNLEGEILGLPPTFTAPDFDGAGSGVCLVWYITYADGLSGLEVGQNANNLDGVFGLSNPITVNRLDAPVLNGGPFTFIVDGVADNIAEGAITVEGGFALENQSSWVVTDDQRNILAFPPSFTAPNFDDAGEGTCYIYYITYGEGLSGLEASSNLDDLMGVYELSNRIDVNRVVAPAIAGGSFDFIVDGMSDNLAEGAITVENSGTDLGESGWIITDTEGLILGLPESFTGPDFDGAGAGTCLVWYINYAAGITGLAPQMNAFELEGVFALSNSIAVNRLDAPELVGGPFTFDVGDGAPDNLQDGDITVNGGYALEGQSSWVVTDDAGMILGLPGSFTAPDFDGAGVGTCNIYYITWGEGLMGLELSGNIASLSGAVYELSNPIEIIRQ